MEVIKMGLKLNRAANQVMEKKIWRDNQIKNITKDLDSLEETIRDNWNTVGYIDIEVLYSANDFIEKHMNLRDKRVRELKEWLQEINTLADERASFSSCLR